MKFDRPGDEAGDIAFHQERTAHRPYAFQSLEGHVAIRFGGTTGSARPSRHLFTHADTPSHRHQPKTTRPFQMLGGESMRPPVVKCHSGAPVFWFKA